MKELEGIHDASLSDDRFVEIVEKAVERDDRVVIAYALGTLENVDTSWPELDEILSKRRI